MYTVKKFRLIHHLAEAWQMPPTTEETVTVPRWAMVFAMTLSCPVAASEWIVKLSNGNIKRMSDREFRDTYEELPEVKPMETSNAEPELAGWDDVEQALAFGYAARYAGWPTTSSNIIQRRGLIVWEDSLNKTNLSARTMSENCWIIVYALPPEHTMFTWPEAEKALKDGYTVRRCNWGTDKSSLKLIDGLTHWVAESGSRPAELPDFDPKACDWIIL